MIGPTPTSPQSLLQVLGECDNFRVSPLPQENGFRTDQLVPWKLDTKPSSPAIGLLRAPIVEQLRKENDAATERQTPAPWAFYIDAGREVVSFADWVDTPVKRTKVMLDMCTKWRDAGLFPGVIGPTKWRNEMYPIYRQPFGKRDAPYREDLEVDGHRDEKNFAIMMERAACALFGAVTYGVHLTVYTVDKEGVKIWVPTRSRTKPTWPGWLDNTVAGGIPSGYNVFDTLIKEASEEASCPEEFVKEQAKSVGSASYFYW